MPLVVDEAFLRQTVVDLVRIDSRNPLLVAGGPGDALIADYVARSLTRLGLDVATHEVAPNQVNVVGRLKGRGGGRALLLNGHLDTVGIGGMIAPFSGDIRDGRVYGRGSQDMKGSLAAMIAAAKALVDAHVPLAGDLLVTAVGDEEYASRGMEDLVRRYRADAAIVTEPTDMQLVSAHRGFAWFLVEVFGQAAHGSRFDVGVDANMRMGRFLAELDKLEQDLRGRTPHPLAGPPSLHAATIHGGTGVSTYAGRCALEIEWRTVPGETPAGITGELQRILDRLAAADPSFRATLILQLARPPLETNADAPIMRTVDGAMRGRLGRAPVHAGVSFWTDAALLAGAGIDAILLGPVGDGLHSTEEWVDLVSLRDLANVLVDTAIAFCG